MCLTTSPHPDLPQLRFLADLRLTHDQFDLLCAENLDAVLELASDDRVIALIVSPEEHALRVCPSAGEQQCLENPADVTAPPDSSGSTIHRAEIWKASPAEQCLLRAVFRRQQGFPRALAVQEMTQSSRLVMAALP